jgi:hypothetical protein
MRILFFFLFIPFALTAQNNTVDFSAALTVINSFDSIQKAKSVFPFDEMSRYDWNYLPPSLIPRKGVCLKDKGDNEQRVLFKRVRAKYDTPDT